MKLTRHNGRAGKNGVYNPKHNDRNFNVKNSEHIDPERICQNVYWDCYQGFFRPKNAEEEQQMGARFEQVERAFYMNRYFDYCEAQHERNRKTGHTERNRDPEDILKSKKTAPEELGSAGSIFCLDSFFFSQPESSPTSGLGVPSV